MKKYIKISALSFTIIACLFLLTNNETHAINGQVSFSITGVTNTQCVYNASWPMGQYQSSVSVFTASGSVGDFICTDTQGLSSWSMTLQATSPVTNGNTSIPASNVSMQATTNQVTAGTCTTGTNTTTMTSIGTAAGTIMKKESAANQICTITTSSVTLNVIVPGYSSIGIYTGTLSLFLPW